MNVSSNTFIPLKLRWVLFAFTIILVNATFFHEWAPDEITNLDETFQGYEEKSTAKPKLDKTPTHIVFMVVPMQIRHFF